MISDNEVLQYYNNLNIYINPDNMYDLKRFKYNILLDHKFKKCVCNGFVKRGTFEKDLVLTYNYEEILKLNKKDKEEFWRILKSLKDYNKLQEKIR